MWERGNIPPELNYTRVSFGVRAAPYFVRRVSLQFAIDYVPVSRTEYFDPALNSQARISRDLLILNPALGVDIVQTSRADVTVHYGGAAFGNYAKLELSSGTSGWEDVCHLEAFKGACPSRWSFLGNGGAGIRFFPKKDNQIFFGVDYTRYAGRKNQLVGTLGVRF